MQSLKVRQRIQEPENVEIIVADMTVAYKLVREAFSSRVTLDRPNLQILVEYLEGPSATWRTAGPFTRSANSLRRRVLHHYEFRAACLAC